MWHSPSRVFATNATLRTVRQTETTHPCPGYVHVPRHHDFHPRHVGSSYCTPAPRAGILCVVARGTRLQQACGCQLVAVARRVCRLHTTTTGGGAVSTDTQSCGHAETLLNSQVAALQKEALPLEPRHDSQQSRGRRDRRFVVLDDSCSSMHCPSSPLQLLQLQIHDIVSNIKNNHSVVPATCHELASASQGSGCSRVMTPQGGTASPSQDVEPQGCTGISPPPASCFHIPACAE